MKLKYIYPKEFKSTKKEKKKFKEYEKFLNSLIFSFLKGCFWFAVLPYIFIKKIKKRSRIVYNSKIHSQGKIEHKFISNLPVHKTLQGFTTSLTYKVSFPCYKLKMEDKKVNLIEEIFKKRYDTYCNIVEGDLKKERHKAYNKTDKYKAYHKAYNQRPEVKERMRKRKKEKTNEST